MRHSMWNLLAKPNHLWLSVYSEIARGALAEDLRPHSLQTHGKGLQSHLLPQLISLKRYYKALVLDVAQHTCRALAVVVSKQVRACAIVLTGAGVTLVDLSLTHSS